MPAVNKTAAELLAHSTEVGSRIRTASGQTYHVVGKSVTSSGAVFTLKGADNKTLIASTAKLADMQPITRAIEKFARMTRLAFNQDFDDYINGAIKAAGYPTDPKMQWAKWLDSIYRPALQSIAHQDMELIDEGIHALIVHELYEKRVLEPDSKFAHFDPDNAALEGKTLDKKVSAYLSFLFKNRVSWVRNFIVKEMGSLTDYGSKNYSLPGDLVEISESGRVVNHGDLGESGSGMENQDLLDNESRREVLLFCTAFLKTVQGMERLNDSSKKILALITKMVAEGESRPDIREAVLSSDIPSPRGNKLTEEHWKQAIKLWVGLIRAFAANPKSGFADTPLARAISAEAESLQKAASKIALSPTNPVEPNAPAATIAPPPPPPNPNVQQQQQVQQESTGTQEPLENDFQKPGAPVDPQAQQQDQNPQQNSTPIPGGAKKTIPPEIPGENHMASTSTKSREEIIASIKARRAASKTKRPLKYAKLRFTSKHKAAEVEEALTTLVDEFVGLAEDLDALTENLDLVPEVAEDASIEEKTAAKKSPKFASAFRRLAEEAPEELQSAIQDIYNRLDDLTDSTENFADNLGIVLEEPSSEKEEEPPSDKEEEPKGEE